MPIALFLISQKMKYANVIFPSLIANVRVPYLYISFGTFFRLSSNSRTRNPYDVLGLKSNCSIKDAKKAYIKLCKELHPDTKPGDLSQHTKFIELNNAYITILNSGKRKSTNRNMHGDHNVYWNYRKKNNSETKEHSEKVKYNEFYHQYGNDTGKIKNYRISNVWIITGCFILMSFGSCLYILAYRFATRYTLERVDKKSRRLSESYHDVRRNAQSKEKINNLNYFKTKWSE